MSQDVPIPRQGNRSTDEAAVLDWGPSAAEPGSFTRAVTGLHRDPRFPAVLAGLGGVAALASLLGEWLVMTVPGTGPEGSGTLQVPNGVAEVGNFGVGYLVGLLALTGTVALAFGGTRPARRNARMFGLGVAGALLAFLVAAAASLDDSTRRSLFYPADSGFHVEYGRGLVMAFVAVGLLGAALWSGATVDRLDGPVDPQPSGAAPAADGPAAGRAAGEPGGSGPAVGGGSGDAAGTAAAPDASGGAVPARAAGRSWWPGRRGRPAGPEQPPAPEGLTVERATPFARPPEGPSGRP